MVIIDFVGDVFTELTLVMDAQLVRYFKNKDKHKERKSESQRSKRGKIARSKERFNKLNNAKTQYMDQQKGMAAYKSGIASREAVAKVKKNPALQKRNSKDTSQDRWRCSYHHEHYCHTLGRKDTKSAQCYAHKLSVTQRKEITNLIFEDAVQEEIEKKKELGACVIIFLWKSFISCKSNVFIMQLK